MSLDANKAAARRVLEEPWNNNHLAVLQEVYAPHHVIHFKGMTREVTPEDLRAIVTSWRSAIPDYRYHVEDVIGEGDRVVVRVRFTGTHSAAPLTIPGRTALPQNRRFEVAETLIFRFQDGKIVETWATWDRLHFLEQLGAIDGSD